MQAMGVMLKDNRDLCVQAKPYRRSGEQHVFGGTASNDVEFLVADEVIGITVS